MVIFHGYVSLPEGTPPQKNTNKPIQTPCLMGCELRQDGEPKPRRLATSENPLTAHKNRMTNHFPH
jgi:hypothetical protein